MENELNETEFTDGYNRGYWLYNYEPEVAKLLIVSEIDRRDDFSTGFAEGLKKAEHEMEIHFFDKLRNQITENDLDISK
jgi:hypothetical protein